MAFWCRPSIPFFTSRKWRYFVCVSLTCELHFCFNRQYEMVSFTVEPKTQRKRQGLSGKQRQQTMWNMRHVHQQALRIDSFLPLHSNYSSLGMGSATLVSLLSGIFPMPKGTPNKMKHKEIALFVPVFHPPTWGCALFRSIYLLQTPLWLVKLFQQKTMKSLYFSGF